MNMDRIVLRKIIQEAGRRLYEKIEDRELQNIAGELMGMNEETVISNPGSNGAREILKTGFTTNQRTWLCNIQNKLEAEHVKK